MKFYKLNTLLLYLFVSANNIAFSQETDTFDSLFSASDTVYLNISNDSFLGIPVSVCLEGNNLIWGEPDRFLVFNEEGELIQNYSKPGRGPGEFSSSAYFYCGKDRLSIIDDNQQKISSFKKIGNQYVYDDEIPTGPLRSRKFVQIGDQYFTLNEFAAPKVPTPAISVYEKDKNEIDIGTIPDLARLQLSIRGGGGITISQNHTLFYSYLGLYHIWRWNESKRNPDIFNERPIFFPEIDASEIESIDNDVVKRVRFAFQIPRVTGLFYLEPDLLIQQFDVGDYLKKGAAQKVLIEVWKTEGAKLYTQIEVTQPVAFAKKDLVYIPTDYISKITEKSGRVAAFIGYKLKR